MVAAEDNINRIEFETPTCTFQINQPCNETDKIKFMLYTAQNRDHVIELDITKKIAPSAYNRALPLKVVIHGFARSRFVHNIVKAYVLKGGHNVLFVDWEPLSKKPCYLSAKINTWQVGKCTSLAVKQLVPASYVHIVGFSLGAHIAGIVSNSLNQQFGRKANRITGLDPALPLYALPLDNLKLDPSDADFVDVIHTSVGTFGKLEPCGHQDVYVNEYPVQPGCYNFSNPIVCSHGRATEIFTESIKSDTGFYATPCYSIWYYILGICDYSPSYNEEVLIGEYTDKNSSGILFLRTANRSPYALGRLKTTKYVY